jgi:hypothetical protein
MTTTQTPKWHQDDIEITNGGDHSYGYVILGEVAEWLEDKYSDWDEDWEGEPAPEITERHCCDMAADYWEHLVLNYEPYID